MIWFCVIPALFGASTLAGWALGNEWLKSLLPGLIAMNPVSAVCFIALSAALWLRLRPGAGVGQRISVVIALAVAAIGGLKLCSYLIGFSFPVDRWLFTDSLGDNRMAPNTSLCFFLMGAALADIDRMTPRGYWPAQAAAVLVATLSLVSLIGYSYGATSLYQMAAYVPMALNTATAFGALAIGMLLARRERGVVAVLLGEGAGGVMARRLLPAVIIIPWVLGGLRLIGQKMGYFDVEFGAAMLVATTVLIFVASIGWIASAITRSEVERKHAMDELQRTNAEIRDLYNRAPCGYHSLDGYGTIVAINDTELAWLGYKRDEIVGKKRFMDLIPTSAPNFFRDNFARLKQTGSVKDLEFEMLRKDGSTFPVILNATAIYDTRGEYLSSRSMMFDATEKKRADDVIRKFNEELEQRVADRTAELAAANTDLEEKSRENEMFVYSASHDLRSPLVNLQGFSKELGLVAQSIRQLVAEGNWPAEQTQRGLKLIDVDMQRGLRFIQSAVSRLDGIIDALLRLSRAGRVDYSPEVIDTNQLVARVVEGMSATLFDRGATIDVAELPKCWCDPTAAEQVFANLIGNALSYLDAARPGQIEVGSFPAESAGGSNRAATVFFVKDNGLGIDPAYHGKVFEPLKRLHPEVAKGEGIGLALAKRIVDRHGGAIWFESVANVGTTFFVKLPNPSQISNSAPAKRAPSKVRSSHEPQ